MNFIIRSSGLQSGPISFVPLCVFRSLIPHQTAHSGQPKPKGEKYWWIPFLKKFRPSGWAPGCNSPRKLGYVPRTRDWLVICPALWTDPNTVQTLGPYKGPNGINPQGNLNVWGSRPAAFLHEFAHLVKDGIQSKNILL